MEHPCATLASIRTDWATAQIYVREVVNMIFYLSSSGYAWRLLPHDFLPWETVCNYFQKWRWHNIGFRSLKHGAMRTVRT